MNDRPATRRDATLDVAKAVAIVLIVAGHVIRGLANAGLVESAGGWYPLVDRAIYSVHLAVFAFAAGLVVAGSVQRRGAGPYLRRRLVDFAWLYVLWSLLQGSLQVLLASSVNNGKDWWAVLDLVHPQSHMWFFPWIAVVSLLVALVRPWASPWRAWVLGAASVVLSVCVWGLFGPVAGLQGHGMTAIFVLASIVALPRVVALVEGRGLAELAGIAAAAGLGWAALVAWTPAAGPTYSKLVRTPVSVGLSVLATLLGVVAVVAVSALLARTRWGAGWVAAVGRRSLEIFLAHVLALAATRILLVKVGVQAPVVHIAAGTVAGVAGALALWWLTRTWAPWLWRAPHALTGTRAGA
ncbi:acyltransferase [Schaalia sp. 19OD2882]|uniref:acyltransferase family protein n=1 Tax=Schaalia sp. 19OD2882 TaxID=2794089 RepID=UPI001C1E9619|nr:acyltransferase [Schaalia sp. 19OD2882]QWW19284.1 acyltransferase [Schaalia sp. 19OD2882]